MAVNIDITKSYVLQSIHEKAKPETTFFSDRYFTTGRNDIHAEDKILVEYKKSGERKLAHFVPERGGAIPIERDGYTVAEFGPAYIAERLPLTADELAARGFGEPLIAGSTPAQRAIRLLAEDLETLENRTRRRIEWMCAQLMQNNAITMQEYIDINTKGEVKHIQFYDAVSEHTYTPQNKWNSSDANIIGDVHAMCEMLSDRGMVATDLLIGTDVADVFYKNEELYTMLNKNIAINFGSVDERNILPGVNELGSFNFRGHSLRVFVVGHKYENDNGVTQSYFPSDAAMVTFPNCGRVAYSAVTLMPYGSPDFATIAKSRVTKLFVDNPNNTRAVELYSRPIAMPRYYTPFIFASSVVS
mgnify:FL=1